MADIQATGISFARGSRQVIEPLDLHLGTGELVVLLGPNGAGKTTLLRLLLGLLIPDSGAVLIDGNAASAMSAMDRARRVAYLPQQRELAWPATVHDVAALGRFAYGAALGRLADVDEQAVARALRACELEALATRSTSTLSGGELARMHCARAFAAEAPLLFADEPTSALDPLHQHRVLRLFRDYVDAGAGALLVMHDVELAARYADRLLWLREGRLLADGSVSETLSAERLAEVYGVSAEVSGSRVYIAGELTN